MTLIVQKYGGSSLADFDRIRNVANRISNAITNNQRIVVIVSAMGSMTDDLIYMAHQISDKHDPREMDALLSTGELVSCALMAMTLNSMGYNAISLSGAQAGVYTDTTHGKAKISVLNPQRILDELDNGNVVIVAGFQGVTSDMDVTTLGRGGSDTTAVAIAAVLDADICEIYTDVDGIYTADPKLVPNAKKLDSISFEDMLEMASYGAKMDPRSIELGMVYNIPLVVASSTGSLPGTLIHEDNDMESNVGEIRNRVIGIATDTNVAKITVLGIKDSPGMAANLFEPLSNAGVSVDVIVQNASVAGKTDLTFTVNRADLKVALEIVETMSTSIGSHGVISADNLAKISIVGTGIQNAPGYASKMFHTLAKASINIEMITTSEIRITCIIDQRKIGVAARSLHDAFQLETTV